jgi:cytochrome c
MKVLKCLALVLALIGIIFAYQTGAAKDTEAPSYGSMTGNIEKGKILFQDKKFGNGTAGKSCNSCHPEGRGLEMSGVKKEFNIMGKKQNSLEEAVNFCIVNAVKGTAIDANGQDMKDIISYIKSLRRSNAYLDRA